MKTILRNFISVLRRFKTASVLNVLGLSIAFVAFMRIMIIRSIAAIGMQTLYSGWISCMEVRDHKLLSAVRLHGRLPNRLPI
jgi:hypothetical protein